MSFDPKNMSRQDFDDRIAELERDVLAAKRMLDEATAMVAWWREGRDLFSPEPADTTGTASSPPQENGSRPTLRQAIKVIMAESPTTRWRAPELFGALSERGWSPNGKHGEDILRGMLSTMRKDKEVVRVGYGVYALPGPAPAEP
jgi:hypothetical protein